MDRDGELLRHVATFDTLHTEQSAVRSLLLLPVAVDKRVAHFHTVNDRVLPRTIYHLSPSHGVNLDHAFRREPKEHHGSQCCENH